MDNKYYKRWIYKYNINNDNEPMIVAHYHDRKDVLVYFPNKNKYTHCTTYNFSRGKCYSYSFNYHRNDFYNEFYFQPNFIQVFVLKNNKTYGSFIFDYEDYDKVKDFIWYFDKDGYIISTKGVRIHNLLINPSKGLEVDHFNRLKWDNRRCNLNIVDRTNNNYNQNVKRNNTSGLIGISFYKKTGQWESYLRYKDVSNRRRFPTKLEAAIYRRRLELQYSRYSLRPELEEYLLENISDENLLIELELKSK